MQDRDRYVIAEALTLAIEVLSGALPRAGQSARRPWQSPDNRCGPSSMRTREPDWAADPVEHPTDATRGLACGGVVENVGIEALSKLVVVGPGHRPLAMCWQISAAITPETVNTARLLMHRTLCVCCCATEAAIAKALQQGNYVIIPAAAGAGQNICIARRRQWLAMATSTLDYRRHWRAQSRCTAPCSLGHG
jgi:hypothetical protein